MLTVNSSVAGSPQTVALSGTAGAPSAGPITVSTLPQFGFAGSLQDLTVSNYGTTPLTIRGITSSDPSFVVETNGCGTYLPAQSACTVTVQSNGIQYQDGTPLVFSGTLTIDDDASTGAQKVALASQNYDVIEGSTIAFGSWPVRSSVSGKQLYIMPGSGHVAVNADFILAGTNPADFALSVPSCYSLVANPCTVGITFLPSATGTRTAHILVYRAEYIRVTGVGTPAGPSLTVSLAGSSFFQGQAYINQYGGASLTDSYTLVNNGTTTLNLSFTSTGAAAADFTPTSNCASLAPQASCALSVAFALPAGSAKPGTYPAQVVIADSATSYTQTLATPVVVFYPSVGSSPLYFPATAPGNTSAPMTLQVSNGSTLGNLPLGDPVSISAPATANFQVVGPTTCPASSTQVCTFSLVFTPTKLGYLTDSVTLTDTVSGNTTTATLTGTGGNSAITLSTRTLTFPTRASGTTSVAMTSTLTNSGTLPLTFNSITLVGVTNGNFTESNNCDTSLDAGSSCTLSISFSPSTAGSQGATLQILSNAPSSPDTITLSGTAQ